MVAGRLDKYCRSIVIQRCNPFPGVYLFLLTLLFSFNASATQRVYHIFDQSSGLPVSTVNSIAQDAEGFFWLSTAGGLFRYDGKEFRHWAKDKITSSSNMVYAGPNGEVLVGNDTLYRVLPNEDAEILIGIDGKPFTKVRDVVFTGDGRLWVARPDALFYRTAHGEWNLFPLKNLDTKPIRKLTAGFNGLLYVVTKNSILEIAIDNSVRTIIKQDLPDNGVIANVIEHPDGSFYFMEKYPKYGRILRLHDGQITELISMKTNLQQFVLRGLTVWASSDTNLFAFRPGEEPEILRPSKDIPSRAGGFLMVDKEGSLWVCASKGLIQYPEPETVIWDDRDGFPITSFIRLLKTDEGIWIQAWGYITFLFTKTDKGWRAKLDPQNPWWLCLDGQGTVWGHRDYSHFYRRDGGLFIKLTPPARGYMQPPCSQASDGTVWIAAEAGLWRTSLDNAPPHFFGNPLGKDEELLSVLEDSKGRLWISSGGKICQTSAAAVSSGQQSTINCEMLNGSPQIRPIEMSDGSLWAGSGTGGVWRYTGVKWEPLPGYLKFPSKDVLVDPSPSGGAWVYGDSMPVRAISRPDLPDGWQVVESVSIWQGVPQVSTTTMLEDSDGSLWLGTVIGLVRMPAAVRHAQTGNAPRVKLVHFVMNGERFDLQSSLQVPPGNNQLEIHFAALTYRDRSLLKLQYRLHEGDEWIDLSGNDPILRFFNLGADKYSVELRASLDGVNWSETSAGISFEILPPWYFRWWAIAFFILLTAFILYTAYRLRFAMLFRLERQRTRIAMDLHDEIGSGLGSIGILSSVVSSEIINEEKRQELTKRISETASEIGSSLTDIVWSLRSDKATLESLAYHLNHRAENLFANGATKFSTKFPDDWRDVNLSLSARRNVLLIAMESLHNAAKHAQAENVTLEIEQADGRNWIMKITDDGFGFQSGNSNNNDSGLGMQSMKRRAEEIGAEISWTTNNGRGTIVSLKFSPNAKERG
jgi:ligand-binding sensor domain-containing protein/two-component sensor histidine kinase